MEKIKLLSKLCVALLGIFLSIEGMLFACFIYLKMSGEDLCKLPQQRQIKKTVVVAAG